MRYSPDGSVIAAIVAAPTRRPVVLLDPNTLEPLAAQPRGAGWSRWQVSGIDFSADGTRLAVFMWRVLGHGDDTRPGATWVYVWDLAAPEQQVAAKRVRSDGISAALTTRGDAFFTTQPLTRHEVVSGRSVQVPLPWGKNSAEVAEMSPSGDVLGVSGWRFGAAVLDPRTGRVLRQMEADEGDQPFYLSFSDDGRRMATVEFNRREAVVWDVATGKNLARVPLSTDGEVSDLGADGSTVYTAGTDGALRHWDVDGSTTVPCSSRPAPRTTAWAGRTGVLHPVAASWPTPEARTLPSSTSGPAR